MKLDDLCVKNKMKTCPSQKNQIGKLRMKSLGVSTGEFELLYAALFIKGFEVSWRVSVAEVLRAELMLVVSVTSGLAKP